MEKSAAAASSPHVNEIAPLDIELVRDIGDNRTGAVTAWGNEAIGAVQALFRQRVKRLKYKPFRTQDYWFRVTPNRLEGRTFYFQLGRPPQRPGLRLVEAALAAAELSPRIRTL
jgi:hypothetical protein